MSFAVPVGQASACLLSVLEKIKTTQAEEAAEKLKPLSF
jgi:hypothetical protein